MLINKIVIGVSGGPDSMYLLNELIKNKRFEPIVVHVNYNFREESNEEQEFVEQFCKVNNVRLYINNVQESDWNKYKHLGNKQSMARELRYDEYFKVAKENNTKHIFVAHHKDDFIETAIMQEAKSGDYLYFGIPEETRRDEYIIRRPLLNKWKSELIESLEEDNIEYKVDSSNLEPIYERNRVRLELSNKTKEEKEEIYNKFAKMNKEKKTLRKEVDDQFEELKESEFDWDKFNNIPKEVRRFVVYKWLTSHSSRVNISSDKLDGVVEFLLNKRGDKSYRLMENIFMSVKKGKIIIYNNYGNRE